ncbi:MAG TPA: NAD-dependent epimerase/dehydratase family protein [Anaeromyxobacter sp.]
MAVLILGCGYTGSRVSRASAARGDRVIATVRSAREAEAVAAIGAEPLLLEASDLASVAGLRAAAERLGGALRVLFTIPPARRADGAEITGELVRALAGLAVRFVYLSSTSVYGDARQVDETTPAAPVTERARLRIAAERAVAAGSWSWIVLRPAAIYGPGRGALAPGGGRFRHATSLDAVVSRAHVDDLAAIAVAALDSADVSGTFPVADEGAASAREILARQGRPAEHGYCADPRAKDKERVVDGRAILRQLGVTLRYPTVDAALAADDSGRGTSVV